ncbi:hypothetical protein TI39_contig278g00057 [Zymoseptoria brevis]|uniref:Uncharacterized protein n=1 Tax=Zymoseptoria brevis TaxID=1047168 RepID=A0A0F4GXS2_9PEZI|nr:hypothetical protein TI39_contig278g00057 [Zymoseptoria brevis]
MEQSTGDTTTPPESTSTVQSTSMSQPTTQSNPHMVDVVSVDTSGASTSATTDTVAANTIADDTSNNTSTQESIEDAHALLTRQLASVTKFYRDTGIAYHNLVPHLAHFPHIMTHLSFGVLHNLFTVPADESTPTSSTVFLLNLSYIATLLPRLGLIKPQEMPDPAAEEADIRAALYALDDSLEALRVVMLTAEVHMHLVELLSGVEPGFMVEETQGWTGDRNRWLEALHEMGEMWAFDGEEVEGQELEDSCESESEEEGDEDEDDAVVMV